MSHHKPNLFIALPQRPGEGICDGLAKALGVGRPMGNGNMGEGFNVWAVEMQPLSLLTTNFNNLWVAARNCRRAWFLGRDAQQAGVRREIPTKFVTPKGLALWAIAWLNGWDEAAIGRGAGPVTHFLMVHSDVCPRPGRWVQDMLAEMDKHRAQVCSAVIAVKEVPTVNSSTAVMRMPSQEMRKLTLLECATALPPTFTAADAGGDALLVNTGLLLCDIRETEQHGDWARKVCFRIYDRVIPGEDGIDSSESIGEDFLFGVDCWRLGLKVVATTKVAVDHVGQIPFSNQVTAQQAAAMKQHGVEPQADPWFRAWNVDPPEHWQQQQSSPATSNEVAAPIDSTVEALVG